MPFTNPSFETAGASVGLAASWTLQANGQSLQGQRDTFESGWRMPMSTAGYPADQALPVGAPAGTPDQLLWSYGLPRNRESSSSAANESSNFALQEPTDLASLTLPGAGGGGDFNAVASLRQTGLQVALNLRVDSGVVAGAAMTVTVTYTTRAGAAGHVATGTLPLGSGPGSSVALTLQEGDSDVASVQAIALAGAGTFSGTVFAQALSTPRTWSALSYAHGTTAEAFELGWGTEYAWSTPTVIAPTMPTPTVSTAGSVHTTYATTEISAFSFGAIPALLDASELVERFESGWAAPLVQRPTRVLDSVTGLPVVPAAFNIPTTLVTFRLIDNVLTPGATIPSGGAAGGAAYPLGAQAVCRVTRQVGSSAVTLNVSFLRFAGDAVQTASVVLPANAPAGTEYSLVADTLTSAHHAVYQVTAITKAVALLQLGEVQVVAAPLGTQAANQITRLPSAALVTAGAPGNHTSYDAFVVVGSGPGALRYESTTSGALGTPRRVSHVSTAGTATTSVSQPAAGDVLVSLRTSAAGAVLATASEVAQVLNTSGLPVRAALFGVDGVVPVTGYVNLVVDVDVAAATFSGGGAVETFESGWLSNETWRGAYAPYFGQARQFNVPVPAGVLPVGTDGTYAMGTVDLSNALSFSQNGYVLPQPAGVVPMLLLSVTTPPNPTMVADELVTYQNQAGTGGRAALAHPAPSTQARAGGQEVLALQVGDTSVRLVTGMAGVAGTTGVLAAIGVNGYAVERFERVTAEWDLLP